MTDTGFDDYLTLCGWRRIQDAYSHSNRSVDTFEDPESTSDGGFSDDWGEEEGHFRVSERRIRDYLFHRHELNNEEDTIFLKDLEQRLFGQSCSMKYIRSTNGIVKNFKKYNKFDSNADEGIPHNCNDLWENYVHRRKPEYADDCYNNSSGTSYKIREFDQMLNVELKSFSPVLSSEFELKHSERFRGNLLANSSRHGVMFVAYKTKLLMKFDLQNDHNYDFVIDFDVDLTTDVDRLNAIHWENPHHINILKIKNMDFLSPMKSKEVLAVGLDDSTVILFDIEDIVSHARGDKQFSNLSIYNSMSNPSPYQFTSKGKQGKILPFFQYHLTASVWGVDMNESLLIVSDNSHTITVFDFSTNEVFKSEELSHNVPCVSIIDYKTICAITYDGIQYLLEISEGELKVVDKTKVLYNGWSCAFYPKVNFLPVDNFLELTGDDFIDQPHLAYSLADILISKNDALGFNNSQSSDFGMAGLFQRIEIQANESVQYQFMSAAHSGELCLPSTQFHRRAIVHKLKKPTLSPYVLINATESNIGMWHIPPLLNCAYTRRGVFPTERDVENAFAINARVNIMIPIVDLQCLIVGSNGGHLELLRFVEHRGVYSLRREWVLAEVHSLILGVSTAPKNGGWSINILLDNYVIMEMWIGSEDDENGDNLNLNFL